MASSRLSRHFFIKDDNVTANSIQKTFQKSTAFGQGRQDLWKPAVPSDGHRSGVFKTTQILRK